VYRSLTLYAAYAGSFFIILFAAFTVNTQILVRFPGNFQHFSVKIVQINSLSGAIVLFAAFSVYGRIYVCFFLKLSSVFSIV